MISEQWVQLQMKAIRKELKEDWGRGWSRLGDELQSALIDQKILNLVYAQGMEKYAPAVELIDHLKAAKRKKSL